MARGATSTPWEHFSKAASINDRLNRNNKTKRGPVTLKEQLKAEAARVKKIKNTPKVKKVEKELVSFAPDVINEENWNSKK